MRLSLAIFMLSPVFSHDLPTNYLNASCFEDLQEVPYDHDGNMLLAQAPQPLSSVDLQIIDKTNRSIRQIEQDLADLLEVQRLLNEHINIDGEKLNSVEQQAETAVTQTNEAVEQIQQAQEFNTKNRFLSLFLTGGIPLSAGVGTAGFFATKATILAAAPALAATAAPVIIPTALALAAGGATLAASSFIIKRLLH
ncbi:MAG: hypothetical protein KF798_03930 [Candidatus Paracaedibacteraceae bacterium]|nr:hypothetical protein [Candidatus Paracaedibacteraceae bacterium]